MYKRQAPCGFVGTARFASAAALDDRARARAPPAPADDLEGLAYVLAYLLRGTLPWAGAPEQRAAESADGARALAELKRAVPPAALCGPSAAADGGADHDAFAAATDAIGALLREARESATPDLARCEDHVERALARVRRRSPEDADSWDWTREGVEWMDDGIISLRLYDQDSGAG